ncbi:hypothetical protein OG689_36490 [Kitasatospora sp. NBC_00240]|uniref:hypothetical protein n=1 Tax=Kitasatospora sp. NBC_00240 TaxID=2903567 RepID=UPI00224EED6E|nr:hypothetical protein [Kitasatospora sp. NBC_00240]MCX5214696.1 hypothetical protein [Kitasatospora sp. NBC_00240]
MEEDFQLATTVLAVTRARTTTAAPSGHRLIPPDVREVLRLLRITALSRPRRDRDRDRDRVLHRSAWRRQHQHQAARAHRSSLIGGSSLPLK